MIYLHGRESRCSKRREQIIDLWVRSIRSSRIACRRCWGVTCSSRTLQNYKSSPYGPGSFCEDVRDFALRLGITGNGREEEGAPQAVARALHKTEAIYRRYAIVDAGALRDVAARIDRAAGTIPGTTNQNQASGTSKRQVRNPRNYLILGWWPRWESNPDDLAVNGF